MITSTHNPRVGWIKALLSQGKARREESAFVVEGVRLVEEALAAGIIPRFALYSDSLSDRGQQLVNRMQTLGVEALPAAPHVLKAASDTQTPQGLLAVLPLIPRPIPALLDFVLILDGVRDPGNLGTILRTAAAAGVQAVLLTPGSADPYAPKVVRAGMGAHFRLPVHALGWDELTRLTSSLQVFLADASASLHYTDANLAAPCAVLVGGEAEGAGKETRQLTPTTLSIPMPGGMESLNAAVAAGVLLFEAVRQRRESGSRS